MKYLWTLIPLILTAAAVAETPQSESSEPMPEVAYMDEETDTYPSWVRADRVLDSEGRVDRALFDPVNAEALERMFDSHPKGKTCMVKDQKAIREGADRIVPFEEIVRDADWIFEGIITGKIDGFGQHRPGNLLRVEPDRTLHGPQNRTFPHFFFIPAGNVSVGNMAFCTTDPVYTAIPEVGDRVLLALELDWFTRGAFLWGLSDHRLFIQGPSEKPRFSPRVTFADKWLGAEIFNPIATAEAILEDIDHAQ